MERLTVFTPTYNRVDLLGRAYYALRQQTCKDFIWMIIDDGSTDNTREIVNQWAETETQFKIIYCYKDNGGLQSGYVEAIKHLETELAMCVDSDDYLVPEAVEKIISFWDENGSVEYAGILALDKLEDGHIIGGYYSEGMKEISLIDLSIAKIKRTENDRILIIRSELYKQARPAKLYPGEKTINATYLHLQIGEKYPFLILNEPVCVVEYQTNGITKNKIMQYIDRPNTFADFRIYMLSLDGANNMFYVRNAIHYVSSCIISKRKIDLKQIKRKHWVILALPLGVALTLYIRYKAQKLRRENDYGIASKYVEKS